MLVVLFFERVHFAAPSLENFKRRQYRWQQLVTKPGYPQQFRSTIRVQPTARSRCGFAPSNVHTAQARHWTLREIALSIRRLPLVETVQATNYFEDDLPPCRLRGIALFFVAAADLGLRPRPMRFATSDRAFA